MELPETLAAIVRVVERVRQGGHHIPEAVIRRRFAAGLRNLERAYKAEVDTWAVYDNVGDEPTVLDWPEDGFHVKLVMA